MPAEPFEQLESPDAVNQIVGIAIGQRRDAESDVAKHFDVNPSQAERHQRAEQRVVGDADHRFDATRDHRLNHDTFAPRSG